MSEKLYKHLSIVEEAKASIQADIDSFNRRASWSAIPGWGDLPGWSELFDTPDMWMLKVRADWGAVGATEESIVAEAMRLRAEAKGGQGGR